MYSRPIVARAMEHWISKDHDVVALHRGGEALRLIKNGARFDAIVCDLMMPEMTGMDFHIALAQFAPDQAQAIIF